MLLILKALRGKKDISPECINKTPRCEWLQRKLATKKPQRLNGMILPLIGSCPMQTASAAA
jgi:hypothetical protein